jgi:hypothetical protein
LITNGVQIHAFVQDTNDFDAVTGYAVKDDMRAAFSLVIASAVFWAGASGGQLQRNRLDILLQAPQINLRLCGTPMRETVFINIVHLVPRPRR